MRRMTSSRCAVVCLCLLHVSCSDVPGTRILGLDGIVQRNAVVTQPFTPTLLTPDGRLGVMLTEKKEDGTGDLAVFRAYGDAEAGVQNGWPVIKSPMSHGAEKTVPLAPLMREVKGFTNSPWTPSGQGALVHDPRWSSDGKPFTVADIDDCANATPGVAEDPQGAFDCYRLLHLQPRSLVESDVPPKTARSMLALFQAPVTVVVQAWSTAANQRTRLAQPNVVYAFYTEPFVASRSKLEGVPRDPDLLGLDRLLHALESSATADGRLMVAEGTKWAFNETPWKSDAWTAQRPIEAMFEAVRDDVEGLRQICRHIDPFTHTPTCTSSQLEDFSRVYPLAAHPFYRADGPPLQREPSPLTKCGYVWITPEGTDVFCRPNPCCGNAACDFSCRGSPPPVTFGGDLVRSEGFESSTGMEFFAVGQHTGWSLHRIDGGINTRRINPDLQADADSEHRPFSPVFLNTSTGFWAEHRVPGDRSLPFLRQWPLFQFMTQNNALRANPERYEQAGLLEARPTSIMQYWEAGFTCSVDPDCLLHLPMNEMRYELSPDLPGTPQRAQKITPDVSANVDFPQDSGTPPPAIHPHRGVLSAGAVFAGEVFGDARDEWYQAGFHGTAIAFKASGEVTIAAEAVDGATCGRNKGCLVGETYERGFTAQLAFLATTSFDSLRLPLAQHSGLWSLAIEDGYLVAGVTPAGGAAPIALRSTCQFNHTSLDEPLSSQANQWVHVALRASVDEGTKKGTVTLFLNGLPHATAPLPAGATLSAANTGAPMVRVGPAGVCVGCGDGWVMLADEVVFHRRPLEDQQIAAFAYAFGGRHDFLHPGAAREMLATHFAHHNPRALALEVDGFPKSVNAHDLRIPSAFAPYGNRFSALVQLGEALFSSPLLSTNSAGKTQDQEGTTTPMTCAVCHDPQRAFTDGRATALGVKPLALNAPTIVNRAFGTNQFFDRRSGDIVDQALRPIVNDLEMRADLVEVIAKVHADPVLRPQIISIFGNEPASGQHLALALAAYQIVQLSVDSLSDLVISTNCSLHSLGGVALDPERVRRGRHLFMHEARCAACHVEPNFSDELMRDTGVAATPSAFKTATLWDLEATGPYFHDGSRGTLREVLEFYQGGGPASRLTGAGLRMLDPEIRPLALSEDDVDALEQYLIGLQNAGPVLQADHPSCLDKPGWPDGTICGPGTTCKSCANTSTYWWTKGAYACGSEAKWTDGTWCAAGSSCGQCLNPATTWAGVYRCGTMPASLKTWTDGTYCALGTTCDYCAQAASYWWGKAFTACGSEPKWSDGTVCGPGTSCNVCANGSTYWWSKAAVACGSEPKWSDGTVCGPGTSCNVCANGSTYWWSKAAIACGSEPRWSDGTVCGPGTSCNVCANGSTYWWSKAAVACGSEPKWGDGALCGLGSTCNACQNAATFWFTKGFTACGIEVLAASTCCAAGSSCNSCANGWDWVATWTCASLAQCK